MGFDPKDTPEMQGLRSAVASDMSLLAEHYRKQWEAARQQPVAAGKTEGLATLLAASNALGAAVNGADFGAYLLFHPIRDSAKALRDAMFGAFASNPTGASAPDRAIDQFEVFRKQLADEPQIRPQQAEGAELQVLTELLVTLRQDFDMSSLPSGWSRNAIKHLQDFKARLSDVLVNFHRQMGPLQNAPVGHFVVNSIVELRSLYMSGQEQPNWGGHPLGPAVEDGHIRQLIESLASALRHSGVQDPKPPFTVSDLARQSVQEALALNAMLQGRKG
jgi:hypothetical protein